MAVPATLIIPNPPPSTLIGLGATNEFKSIVGTALSWYENSAFHPQLDLRWIVLVDAKLMKRSLAQ